MLSMRSSIAVLALPAFLFELASAHGFVQGVTVDGDWTPGADPVWYYYSADSRPATAGWDALNQDNGFVAPDAFTTTDIACHKSAFPSTEYVEVAAGDTITFYWNTWPDSHKGPIINYIAPCSGKS
jgi:lytic cellulose monooxygenase (C1-hydroxylating)